VPAYPDEADLATVPVGPARNVGAFYDALAEDLAKVQKHVQHILTKLQLAPGADDHRRVLAVFTWLKARKGRLRATHEWSRPRGKPWR
jgi:hypothetical protein